MQAFAFRISAVMAFLAVVLGAFGAHGLQARLLELNTGPIWQTAVLYHLVHGVALLVVVNLRPWRPWAWGALLAGILIFSGSLYVLAVTGIRGLGAITPLGGLAFLLGWALVAVNPPPFPSSSADEPKS